MYVYRICFSYENAANHPLWIPFMKRESRHVVTYINRQMESNDDLTVKLPEKTITGPSIHDNQGV